MHLSTSSTQYWEHLYHASEHEQYIVQGTPIPCI
uniref:Uncharacterized protein n=1 Tax=Amphimedon queenslandica TaxID=400682 RepID=A0A1X7U3I5_AMPQE